MVLLEEALELVAEVRLPLAVPYEQDPAGMGEGMGEGLEVGGCLRAVDVESATRIAVAMEDVVVDVRRIGGMNRLERGSRIAIDGVDPRVAGIDRHDRELIGDVDRRPAVAADGVDSRRRGMAVVGVARHGSVLWEVRAGCEEKRPRSAKLPVCRRGARNWCQSALPRAGVGHGLATPAAEG